MYLWLGVNMRKIDKNQQGSILIITLIVLSLVTVISLSLSKYSFFDYTQAKLNSSQIEAKVKIENLKVALIAFIKEEEYILNPEDLEKLQTQWPILAKGLDEDVETNIIDLNAKFPINALFQDNYSSTTNIQMRGLFSRLLLLLLKEHGSLKSDEELEEDAQNILTAINQWCGEEDLSQESLDWYLVQDPPYLPTQEPLKHHAELNLIYYDIFEEDYGQDFKERFINGSENIPGLADLIQVYSDGPLNIFSLEPLILQAMLNDMEVGEEFKNDILEARKNPQNLEENVWFAEIFEKYNETPLVAQVLSDKTRQIQLNVRLGNADFYVDFVGLGFLFPDYISWHYQKIQ